MIETDSALVTPRSVICDPALTLLRPKLPETLPLVRSWGLIFERFDVIVCSEDLCPADVLIFSDTILGKHFVADPAEDLKLLIPVEIMPLSRFFNDSKEL